MSAWQLIAAAILYGWVTIDLLREGKLGMALAFAAYAIANVGFLLDLRGK